MTSIRKIYFLIAAGFLVGVTSLTGDAGQPSILFIFSDDHRYDLLGVVNSKVSTPNLDRLAKTGVRFENALITTPICSPSRASTLSGRYGSRNGVPTNNASLSSPSATFVHDLVRAGYRTAQAGKWHLKTTPAEAGFQDYAAIYGNDSWFERTVSTNISGVDAELGGTFYEAFMADVVIDWIGDHLESHSDEAFMMWWCNQVPHVDGNLDYPDVKVQAGNKTENTPWGSEGGYRATYNVINMPVPENWADDLKEKPPYLATSRFVKQPVRSNYGGPGGYTASGPGERNATLGEDNVQQHMLEYHASVTALDGEIGRVLSFLEDPNGDGDSNDSILDDTWIVFMGDNGWQTGSHKMTSKVLAYEEAVRVPLIVKAPGVEPRVEERLALNIDLTAMFYRIAGVPVPDYVQGRDLESLVRDPKVDWREAVYIELVESPLGSQPYDAVRTDRYKYIRTYDSKVDPTSDSSPFYEELYDLIEDPGEMKNLAEDPNYASVKDDLGQRLEAKKAAVAETPDPE